MKFSDGSAHIHISRRIIFAEATGNFVFSKFSFPTREDKLTWIFLAYFAISVVSVLKTSTLLLIF